MTGKNQQIVAAAANVFKRHGVAKTTMADIAAEAGVSRQTVYNMYDGRDDVLRAVTRHWGESVIEALDERWQTSSGLGEKLDAFFDVLPLSFYDMIQNSPNMADIIEGASIVAKAELATIDADIKDAISSMLADHPQAGIGANTEDLADFVYSTAMNAKHNSADRTQLEKRLQTLKACLLRG